MRIVRFKISVIIVSAFCAIGAVSAVSYADMVYQNIASPTLRKVSRVRAAPPKWLVNPDLPNRKGVEFWKFRVHSAAKVEQQFDNNVFLSDSDTRYDFITVLSPSVGVEVKAGDHRFSADYEVSQFLYGTWHDQNHFDHRVRALAEIKLSDYKITVSDEFRIFTDRAADENSLRLKENTNDFKAGISAQFNKLGFDAGYINKLWTYDSHDLSFASLTWSERAFVDQSVYATASYRWLPKTYLLAGSDIGLVRYYETSQLPDSWYYDGLVGIRGEWTSKITVNLKGGLRIQQYDTSQLIAHKPYVGPVIQGGVEYRPTTKDTIILAVERANYESTYANMNYYTVNMVGLDYKHKFIKKVTGGLFGYYQYHTYPGETTENGVTAKRYDEFFGGGASLRYDVQRWLSLEARYEYRQKISMFDIFDYIDNVITLRGTGGF